MAELEGGEAEAAEGDEDAEAPAEKRAKRCKGKTERQGETLGVEDDGETKRELQRWMIVVYFCKVCEDDEEVFEGLHAAMF